MHPKISLEFGTNFYLVPIFRTCGVYSSRWNPLCRKVNTEVGRFKTRAKMSKGAHDVHSGCLSLIFISCQHFVRMEFIMPVGTNFGGIFNTGSDGFEMNPEMSEGAYEVHSGCLALTLIPCLYYVRAEFTVTFEPVLEESLISTPTDSKCILK